MTRQLAIFACYVAMIACYCSVAITLFVTAASLFMLFLNAGSVEPMHVVLMLSVGTAVAAACYVGGTLAWSAVSELRKSAEQPRGFEVLPPASRD